MTDHVHPTPEREAKALDLPKRLPVVGFKAAGDGGQPGEFHAFVAVMGNVDSHGDRILRGFFEDSLKAPPEGRGLPPVVWTHDWMTPPIGASIDTLELDVDDAKARAAELGVTELKLPDVATGVLYEHGRLLVASDEEHATARAVWAAMKATGGDGLPPLREFSFGYRTQKAEWEEVDPDTLPPELQWTGGLIRDLVKGLLYEVGPTLVGSNPATDLLGVKSAVKRLELAGAVSSDEAATMLREVQSDTPDPTPSTRDAEAAEEVKARIAELAQRKPPEALGLGL